MASVLYDESGATHGTVSVMRNPSMNLGPSVFNLGAAAAINPTVPLKDRIRAARDAWTPNERDTFLKFNACIVALIDAADLRDANAFPVRIRLYNERVWTVLALFWQHSGLRATAHSATRPVDGDPASDGCFEVVLVAPSKEDTKGDDLLVDSDDENEWMS
jgi:hypothetical protein